MTRDYKERLDPGGEVGRMAEFFGSRFGRVLVRIAGGREQSEVADETVQGYRNLMQTVEEAADTLNDLGWIVFELSPVEEYGHAAKLVRDGKPEEAERYLVEAWNEGKRLVFVNRVVGVYSGHPEQHEIGLERQRLVTEAVDLHEAGHYAAAIMIALSQIDGIVFDMTGEDARGFFTRVGKGQHLTDETTLAGHPRGLLFLNRLFNRDVKKSGLYQEARRHGIIHGRSLAFDTRENSTKVLVALISVIAWAAPIGRELAAEATAERQRRYAGSKDLDDDGRRLDRRGFTEGKALLLEIQLFQHGHFTRKGRYTNSIEAFPFAEDAKRAFSYNGASVRVEASDDEFHAVYVTPTGFVFGVAGRGGEYNESWRYAGDTQPAGGPDTDTGWRHTTRDDAHIEW